MKKKKQEDKNKRRQSPERKPSMQKQVMRLLKVSNELPAITRAPLRWLLGELTDEQLLAYLPMLAEVFSKKGEAA